MRVNGKIDISAPPELIWEFVTNPHHYLRFMDGVTRWEVLGSQPQGLGARYRTLMRLPSAEVGSVVEVVEWDKPHDLAWTSLTGIDQRGRWRLRERKLGRTHVEFRLSFGVAGSGIVGWVAEQLAAPNVHRSLQRSLRRLKRDVEHERLRRERG